MEQIERKTRSERMYTVLKTAISVVAILFSLVHIYTAGGRLFPSYQQRPLHLACVLLLLFLVYPVRKKYKGQWHWTKWIDLVLGLCGVFVCMYIATHYEQLALRMGKLTLLEIIIGVILALLVMEGCRRVVGLPLVIVAIVFLLYVFFGQHLPRVVAHSGYSFQRIIQQLSLSTEGLFGTSLGVSATHVAMFLIFGAFLEVSGAGQVFIDLTMSLFGKFRGGPAKATVGAAALFGMISGSQVANVAATGVFTIPLMKRIGYSKEFAGGISAAASTGGMLTPPVLGAAAFLIADMLSTTYAAVVIATIVPAFLYYVSLFAMVDMRAAKGGFYGQQKEELPNFKTTFLQGAHLLIPIVVLVVFLFVLNVSTARAAFWATVSVPICSFFRKSTRMGIKKILKALEVGAITTILIGISCATAGLVMGVVYQTGLGLRFSTWMVSLAQGNLLLLLLLTMVSSIILGMGLPAVAAYLVLAIMGAPALVNIGVNPLAAHLFIFFFGTLSSITPPVANAAYAAAAIAEADPIKTGWSACRLALAAFIVPFMFVYGNELLLVGSALQIILAVITATIGVLALAAALEGYIFIGNIGIIERIMLFAAAVLCSIVGIETDLIGIALVLVVALVSLQRRRKPA